MELNWLHSFSHVRPHELSAYPVNGWRYCAARRRQTASVCQLSILFFASLPRPARSCCAGEGLLQQLTTRCQAALMIAASDAESLINCRADIWRVRYLVDWSIPRCRGCYENARTVRTAISPGDAQRWGGPSQSAVEPLLVGESLERISSGSLSLGNQRCSHWISPATEGGVGVRSFTSRAHDGGQELTKTFTRTAFAEAQFWRQSGFRRDRDGRHGGLLYREGSIVDASECGIDCVAPPSAAFWNVHPKEG